MKEMEDLFRTGITDLAGFELDSPSFIRPLGLVRFRDIDRIITKEIEKLPEGVVGKEVKEQVSIINGKKHMKKILTTRYADGKVDTITDYEWWNID